MVARQTTKSCVSQTQAEDVVGARRFDRKPGGVLAAEQGRLGRSKKFEPHCGAHVLGSHTRLGTLGGKANKEAEDKST